MIHLSEKNAPIFKNDSIEIREICEKKKHFLLFTFDGNFSDQSCEEACEKWNELNQINPRSTFIHVWDCLKMSGFDQSAKKKWMGSMNEMYDQIEEIWIVADNILIRGAARLMSKFSKHELKAFKSVNEVETWFSKQY